MIEVFVSDSEDCAFIEQENTCDNRYYGSTLHIVNATYSSFNPTRIAKSVHLWVENDKLANSMFWHIAFQATTRTHSPISVELVRSGLFTRIIQVDTDDCDNATYLQKVLGE